ncbi:response regulator transcription factor [Geochorda subterranea]|uniref:Response regulator transcription factor n=1 Tax=Geochorda subterranea TaxID=3109564 RepID=A0ABZ1BPZ6_9FIRM|nr:response regulator transcription factor [Limnochorda sp. LNt]WRP14779.1 response regulator transcription factor [Limnochorda sp. LNt]
MTLPGGAAATVLVVEDEAQIADVLQAYLEAEGFGVLRASDGEEALELARRERVDLVLLDLMLPKLDGREVCRRIRRDSDLPIIMLTARDDEVDRVVGLELGADDYITKPFSPREVVARIRAVLRRSRHGSDAGGRRRSEGAERPGDAQPVCRVGPLVVDPARHQAYVGERELDLTPTEFKLLAALASHPGMVFTRLQLVERVQGAAFEGYERTIDAHIKNLRQKLEDDPRHPRFIATVYGVGYKLVTPRETP